MRIGLPGVDPGPPAAPAFSRRTSALLLVGLGLLLALRLPGAWAEGRFQDEEATIFLAFAWNYPWHEALLRPFGGYLNLPVNVITLGLARMVQHGLLPLEHAPYATMVTGLLAQLTVAAVLLRARSHAFAGRAAVLAGLLYLAVAPLTEEVWLNAMHIQFHLALATALLLGVAPATGRPGRIGETALLILAPLSGPGAIVFLPLFIARAAIERDRARWRQAALLGAGAAIQLLLFYSGDAGRGAGLDPVSAVTALGLRTIALALLGVAQAKTLGSIAGDQYLAGAIPWELAIFAGLVFAALLLIALRRRDEALWLFFAAIAAGLLSVTFGIATRFAEDAFLVRSGPRYNYLPIMLFFWGVLALAARPAFPGRGVVRAGVAAMLIVGLYYYPKPRAAYAAGPGWRAEVRIWRADPTHQLAVWPEPWRADLSGSARPCPPPATPTTPDIPRYCAAGWSASFESRPQPLAPDGERE